MGRTVCILYPNLEIAPSFLICTAVCEAVSFHTNHLQTKLEGWCGCKGLKTEVVRLPLCHSPTRDWRIPRVSWNTSWSSECVLKLCMHIASQDFGLTKGNSYRRTFFFKSATKTAGRLGCTGGLYPCRNVCISINQQCLIAAKIKLKSIAACIRPPDEHHYSGRFWLRICGQL
jgi:hypothetical protein